MAGEAGADDDVEVRDNPQAHRFEIWVGGELAGSTRYTARGDGVYAFPHTEVADRFAHRGLAGRLIGAAMDAARDRGWSVLPQCPFVRSYVEEHGLVDLVPEAERAAFGLG